MERKLLTADIGGKFWLHLFFMSKQTVSPLKAWGNGAELPTLKTIPVDSLAVIDRHSQSGRVSTTTRPVDNKDLLNYFPKNDNLTAADGAETFSN